MSSFINEKSNENDHLIAYEVDDFNVINNAVLDQHFLKENSRHIAFFSLNDQYENLDTLPRELIKIATLSKQASKN